VDDALKDFADTEIGVSVEVLLEMSGVNDNAVGFICVARRWCLAFPLHPAAAAAAAAAVWIVAFLPPFHEH